MMMMMMMMMIVMIMSKMMMSKMMMMIMRMMRMMIMIAMIAMIIYNNYDNDNNDDDDDVMISSCLSIRCISSLIVAFQIHSSLHNAYLSEKLRNSNDLYVQLDCAIRKHTSLILN
jgi:hypothetical protein